MNSKLIKFISILLIMIFTVLIVNVLFIGESQAKAQNTKDYTKGSNMLDDYPGYSELLDSLLEKHPNWTFTILYTGLDWDTAIRNETTEPHGRNLVQGKTGEWLCQTCKEPYEGKSWFCASVSTVSYYMDPRNALNEDYIFQFENLKWADGKYTLDGIKQIINDCGYLQGTIKYTNTSGKTSTINKTYAQVIMDAAKEAGISPYHLASRIRQEQGPGSKASATATGKYGNYTGYYNYLNIGASGKTDSAIISAGLEYAKSHGWTDPQKAIVGGAEFLAKEYIQWGQNTLYLQKFDVDDSDGDLYWHQYQTNVSAAKSESTSIMQTYQEIDSNLNMPFNFVIPVFENMPDTKCPMPGTQSIVTQNVEVTASSAVVYKSKDTTSTKLKTLNKGDKVLRIEIDTEKEKGYVWSKVVLDDGTKGYIISDQIKKISDITNCEIEAVAIEPGNVRNGPGTSGTTTLLTLAVGQKVTIIEKGKYNNVDGYNWSRIKMSDGTQGYIVARYLEELDGNGTTATGKDIVKVVANGGLTLRAEPGTSSKILGYLDKGDTATRTEKNVSNKNGYVWDKIVTSSGITAYVARGDSDGNYIEPLYGSDGTNGNAFELSETNLLCEPGVTVANIKEKYENAKVIDVSGKEVTSGNVGTGYTVKNEDTTYTIVKLGDVDRDGKITSLDYVKIKNNIMGKSTLDGNAKLGADCDLDNKITSLDYVKIKNNIMGKSKITL